MTSPALLDGRGSAAGAVATAPAARRFVLTLSCPERPGIVHAVTTFLLEHGFDINEHQQFDDALRGSLFLRTAFSPGSDTPGSGTQEGATPDEGTARAAELAALFRPIAEKFGMDYAFHGQTKPRLLVMVSTMGHCLNDLIFRWRAGTLGGEITVIASNHEALRPMAEAAGLPFVHLPISAATKDDAEARLLALVDEHRIDLVVLARYMQVLTDGLCERLRGRAINIHHSFLPGFKGAKPYHQAYQRGVKLVGATAHYVTPDLDEGPIIEQEVIRVDHSLDPRGLAIVGQDAEALALSRAVRWHCEHRVLMDETSTVVFR